MAIEKGSAGQATRDMADKRYSKRVLITFAGVGAVAFLLFLLPNVKGLGLAGIVIIAIFVRLVMKTTDRETDRYERLEKRAVKGAKAEEKIGDLLRNLPEGYRVYHDVVSPYGNIDHVVLGDNDQVFLIETKAHHGEVTYNGSNLLIDNKMPEKNFISQIFKNTFWLRDEIKKWIDADIFIKPVIVFTNAFVKIPYPVKNISIVNKKYLTKVLTEKQASNNNTQSNPKAVSLSTVLETLQGRSQETETSRSA